jgi:hypothetical protein
MRMLSAKSHPQARNLFRVIHALGHVLDFFTQWGRVSIRMGEDDKAAKPAKAAEISAMFNKLPVSSKTVVLHKFLAEWQIAVICTTIVY